MRLNGPIENSYVEDGKKYVKVCIIADEKPDTLPTTGEDIIGLTENDYIAPGSSIFTINGEVAFRGEVIWGDWL